MIIISKDEQSKSKKKMVEIYRINLNKLDYFDVAKEKKVAKKENREPIIRQSSNIIYYNNKKSQEAVIKIAESELLRIIEYSCAMKSQFRC